MTLRLCFLFLGGKIEPMMRGTEGVERPGQKGRELTS